VDLIATPKGWVPVDFGDAQISVPPTWEISAEGCPLPTASLYIEAVAPTPAAGSCGEGGSFVMITPSTRFAHPSPTSFTEVVNGINVYFSGRSPEPSGRVVATVPSLGVAFSLVTKGSNLTIINTLTYSPRVVVLAPGAAPLVPVSWRGRDLGGIHVSTPESWVKGDELQLSNPPYLTIDEAAGDPAGSPNFAVLAAGTSPIPCRDCNTGGPGLIGAPTDGLIVDPGPYGPLQGDAFGRCMDINGLSVCPTTTDVFGVLVLAVHVPGRSQPVAVEIGLAGNGQIARTILWSLRPSAASPPPTTSTVKSSTTTTTTPSIETLPPLEVATLPVPTDFTCSAGLYILAPANEAVGECIPYAYLVGGTESDPDGDTACSAGSSMTMGPVECDDENGIVTPVPPGPNTCSNPGGPCPSSRGPLPANVSVIPWSDIQLPTGKCRAAHYFGETDGTATCVPYAYLPGGTSSNPNSNTTCPTGSALKVLKVTGTLCTEDTYPYEIIAPIHRRT
jgi:hypothetical protein